MKVKNNKIKDQDEKNNKMKAWKVIKNKKGRKRKRLCSEGLHGRTKYVKDNMLRPERIKKTTREGMK